MLGAGPGTRVVDVGCGAGRAVAELLEREVEAVGVDPSERMIAVARGRWPATGPTRCSTNWPNRKGR
ncbi:class I SAM-dependent methyltransferase [Streptomyces zaomyceticus]|uniref:class I SAM-dependent methyltransferase n=1 Tax=Streptomyces zaomyceticus TaxID=68286 RepID=UPI0035DE9705